MLHSYHCVIFQSIITYIKEKNNERDWETFLKITHTLGLYTLSSIKIKYIY